MNYSFLLSYNSSYMVERFENPSATPTSLSKSDKLREERTCDPKVVMSNYLIPIQIDPVWLRINQTRLLSSSQMVY